MEALLSHWLLRSLARVMNPTNMWDIPNFYSQLDGLTVDNHCPSNSTLLPNLFFPLQRDDDEDDDNYDDKEEEEGEDIDVMRNRYLYHAGQHYDVESDDESSIATLSSSPNDIYVKKLENSLKLIDSLLQSARKRQTLLPDGSASGAAHHHEPPVESCCRHSMIAGQKHHLHCKYIVFV